MPAKVNKKELVHEGRVFSFFTENVTLENGHTTNLDIIRHPGASAMVAVTDRDEVVMVKQFRHAAGGHIWEIPAGTLDNGEAPLECAKRELIEETGYSAGRWRELGEVVPVPGYSDERISLFLARDLKPAGQNLDRDEILTVYRIKVEKALEMIMRGEINDAKTIVGLCRAFCGGAAPGGVS